MSKENSSKIIPNLESSYCCLLLIYIHDFVILSTILCLLSLPKFHRL